MKQGCPQKDCGSLEYRSNGKYYRWSDSRQIKRYFCKKCLRSWSQASLSTCYRQKKRRINPQVNRLLCSGVSQRRIALLLKVHRKTVARRLTFLAKDAKKEHEKTIAFLRLQKSKHVQFDELETMEHSKCKPLSVALAVDQSTRKILSFEVSRMPAKGRLADIARKKYGKRPDHRAEGIKRVLAEISHYVSPDAIITTDECPRYPKPIIAHHPNAKHITVKGQRGCIAGQGELKKIGYDPLFSLNHTCAMLRANINRLFRKTWCTTKNIEALKHHLALYVIMHNKALT